MDKVQEIMNWLESFYRWNDAQWGLDLTGCTPVSCQVKLEDERLLRRKVDIAGISVHTLQTQFSFTRVSYGEEEIGLWISEFAMWVRAQSEEDLAPCFGKGRTSFCLEKSKLETLGDKAVYTGKLIATYNEIYEVS